MDSHILVDGVSQLNFHLGTIAPNPTTSGRISELSYNTALDLSSNFELITNRFKSLLPLGRHLTIMVPHLLSKRIH